MSEQPKLYVLVNNGRAPELAAALRRSGVDLQLCHCDHGVEAAEGIVIDGRLVPEDDDLEFALEQLADPLNRDLKKAESSIDFGDAVRGLAGADAPFHHQLNQLPPPVVRHEKEKSARSPLAVLCTPSENEYDPKRKPLRSGTFCTFPACIYVNRKISQSTCMITT